MLLKGSNRPILDKDGYVHAFIRCISEETIADQETGEALYDCLVWQFEWEGTQHKEGVHKLQTGAEINPADEDGKYNRLTDVCLRLGLLTKDELEDPSVDTDNAVGLRVRYRIIRNEKKQYIMDADSLTLDEQPNGKKR